MELFVKQVESNVKGGVNCALGPKTLIIGPNGSGKCLTGKTRVYDPERSEAVSIKKFVTERRAQILGIVRGKQVPVGVTEWHANGVKSIHRMLLDGGTAFVAADTHPVLTDRGSVALRDIRAGDWVATVRKLALNTQSPRLTRSEARLMGLLLGDGCLVGETVKFSAMDVAVIETFQDCAREVFPGCRVTSYTGREWALSSMLVDGSEERAEAIRKLAFRLQRAGVPLSVYVGANSGKFIRGEQGLSEEAFNRIEMDFGLDLAVERSFLHGGQAIRVWAKRLGLLGLNAYTKHIPTHLLVLPETETCELIGGLWQTDGYVSDPVKTGCEVSYTSASRQLVEDIKILLLRVGVMTTIREKDVKDARADGDGVYWTLNVLVGSYAAFNQRVRLTGRKSDRLNRLCAALAAKDRNPNKDLVPPRFCAELSNRSASGRFRDAWDHRRAGMSRDVFADFGGPLELAESDYFWCKVESVVDTDSKEECFDVTVDSEEHLYVAETLVVHNSSVINSIELALTGRVSDIAGREAFSKEAELLALAPGRAGTLRAKVTISDGTVAEWSASDEKGSKKAKHDVPKGIEPGKVFPLRLVRENLTGSAEVARRFLFQQAVGAITVEDVLKRVPATLHARFAEAAAAGGAKHGDTPLAALLLAQDAAKAGQKEASTKAKAAAAVVEQASSGLPPEPTSSALESARATVREAQEMVVQASKLSALGTFHSQIQTHQSIVVQEKAKVAEIEAALGREVAPDALGPEFGILRDLLAWAVDQHLAGCPCCSRPVDPAALGGTLRRVQDAIDADTTNRERAKLVGAAKREITRLNASIARHEQDIANLHAALANLPQPSETLTIEQATIERDRAGMNLQRLQDAATAWDTIRRSRDVAAHQEEIADEFKRLVKACGDAIGELLDSAVESFVKRVQKFLPETDEFALELRDGAREVCRFGFVKRSAVPGSLVGATATLFTALSGAEWARITVALALACSEGTPLRVIVPEDRAWDEDTLTAVMKALSKAPAQVIIASTVEPEFAPIPAGWAIIQTRCGHHQAGASEFEEVAS